MTKIAINSVSKTPNEPLLSIRGILGGVAVADGNIVQAISSSAAARAEEGGLTNLESHASEKNGTTNLDHNIMDVVRNVDAPLLTATGSIMQEEFFAPVPNALTPKPYSSPSQIIELPGLVCSIASTSRFVSFPIVHLVDRSGSIMEANWRKEEMRGTLQQRPTPQKRDNIDLQRPSEI